MLVEAPVCNCNFIRTVIILLASGRENPLIHPLNSAQRVVSSIPSAAGKCYPRRALPSENPAITAAAPFPSHPNINFIRTVILLYGQKPLACERYFHTYRNHIHSLRRADQPSSMATVISSAQCSFNGSGRTHPRIVRHRQNFAQNDRTACPSVAGGGMIRHP